jgi:hypothetical protein
MATPDIHTWVECCCNAHLVLKFDSAEVSQEIGRNWAAHDILAGPVSVAEIPERTIQMTNILREDELSCSYLE